jgi:hypothetical protein
MMSRVAPFDTSEVRWFAEGTLPTSLIMWFAGAPTSIEIRRDRYLVDALPEAGVKRRDGGPLEVKVRNGRDGWVDAVADLQGRLEEWRKYAPVDDGEWPAEGEWIDVDKVVLTRTYRLGAGGVEPLRGRDLAATGCDVELAAIIVDDTEAWTFALEAWGPEAERRRVLRESLDSFMAETPLPAAMRLALHRDAGYPEWLAGLVNAAT